jgi:hypothetical protein
MINKEKYKIVCDRLRSETPYVLTKIQHPNKHYMFLKHFWISGFKFGTFGDMGTEINLFVQKCKTREFYFIRSLTISSNELKYRNVYNYGRYLTLYPFFSLWKIFWPNSNNNNYWKLAEILVPDTRTVQVVDSAKIWGLHRFGLRTYGCNPKIVF